MDIPDAAVRTPTATTVDKRLQLPRSAEDVETDFTCWMKNVLPTAQRILPSRVSVNGDENVWSHLLAKVVDPSLRTKGASVLRKGT